MGVGGWFWAPGRLVLGTRKLTGYAPDWDTSNFDAVVTA